MFPRNSDLTNTPKPIIHELHLKEKKTIFFLKSPQINNCFKKEKQKKSQFNKNDGQTKQCENKKTKGILLVVDFFGNFLITIKPTKESKV